MSKSGGRIHGDNWGNARTNNNNLPLGESNNDDNLPLGESNNAKPKKLFKSPIVFTRTVSRVNYFKKEVDMSMKSIFTLPIKEFYHRLNCDIIGLFENANTLLRNNPYLTLLGNAFFLFQVEVINPIIEVINPIIEVINPIIEAIRRLYCDIIKLLNMEKINNSDLLQESNSERPEVLSNYDVIFYEKALQAWFNTLFVKDIAILALSAGGICILLFKDFNRFKQLDFFLYVVSLWTFAIALLSVLLILGRNAHRIEENIFLHTEDEKDCVLMCFDFIAICSFSFGLIALIILTIN